METPLARTVGTARHTRSQRPGSLASARRWPRAQGRPARALGFTTAAMVAALIIALVLRTLWPEGDHRSVGPGGSPIPANTHPTPVPDVPTFGGDPRRTGINPGPGPQNLPTVRWALEEDHPYWGAPAVVDGIVYASGVGNSLGALDAATGRILWHFDVPMYSEASPTVANGVVYAGFSDGRVRAFDAATGAVMWEFDAKKQIGSTPAVVDGMVYIGTGVQGTIGDLLALDAGDGTERWRLPLDASGFVAPAVVDGTVYVATGQPSNMHGTVFAVDAATGTERWRFDAGYGFGGVAVVDGVAYTAAYKGVFALDAGSGAVRWQAAAGVPFYTSPVVADGVVYAMSDQDRLYALDAATGSERWSTEVRHTGLSPADPILVDGVLYVAAGAGGRLAAIDAATGDRLWEVDLPGEQEIWSTPTVVGGTLYVGTGTWSGSAGLYALADPSKTSATPAPPASAITPLASVETEAMPPGRTYAGIWRATFEPGAQIAVGPGGYVGDGPTFVVVEQGELEVRGVRSYQPVVATQGGSTDAAASPVTLAFDADTVLGPGDAIALAGRSSAVLANTTAAPAVFLFVNIQSVVDGGGTESDVVWQELAGEQLSDPLTAPSTVTLSRMVLPPGTSASAEDLPGLELLAVEDGTVAVTRSAAGTPIPRDEVATGQGLGFGTDLPTVSATLTNTGDGPATLLVLTITGP